MVYRFLIIRQLVLHRMQTSSSTIIADTSCFIILTKIDCLDLMFQVCGSVITTTEVAQEFGDPLPEWVEIRLLTDISKLVFLEMHLDKGESTAIALALETPNSTVVLDDYKARRMAEILNISYTGTIGILVQAKRMGLVSSIKPLLQKMKDTDFRISIELELHALRAAGES